MKCKRGELSGYFVNFPNHGTVYNFMDKKIVNLKIAGKEID
jgi:hypothetical protein